MRVLHMIKGLGRGGAEILLLETLKVHDKKSHEFHYLYFLPEKSHLTPELEKEGGNVVCLEAGGTIGILLSHRRVLKEIERIRPDVIHAHMPVTGFLARVAGRIARIPVVYTEHYNLDQYGRLTVWLNKLNYNWQNTVVAVSHDAAAAIKRSTRFRGRVQTILNGVNTDHYQRSTGSSVRSNGDLLPVTEARALIATAAVFRRQKQLDLWLRIAAAMLAKDPAYYFVIMGDGPEKESLHQLARDLGIWDRVHFPGLVKNTKAYLDLSDVYLMTSHFEGLPVALLEAMSMSCAPVVTAVGGMADLIEPPTNGLFIDARDTEGSASLLHSLCSTPGEATRLGKGARDTIVKHYSMQRMVGELEAVYRDVLAEPR